MPRGIYDRRPENAKKPWTKAEETYLEESWGRVKLKSIARKLGRSEHAVSTRIQLMGLGPGLQNGVRISFNQFLIALTGRSTGDGYAKKQLIAAGFPVHSQTVRSKKKYTTVDIDEFWEFAEKNKHLFNFAGMEPCIFGPEPEWAKLKRKLDAGRASRMHAHNDPWTAEEDARLVSLLRSYKYTYTELSEKLRRTEGAIKRRIYDLGIRERAVRPETKPWTEEETQALIRMHDQGYGWDNIGQELNRTALGCRGKYERLLNPNSMKRDYRRNHGKSKATGINEHGSAAGEFIRKQKEVAALAECAEWEQVKEGEDHGQKRSLKST